MKAERAFAEYAASKGMRVRRSGWPDFFVFGHDGAAAYLVEVKSATDNIRKAQREMFMALAAIGLQVWIWSPEFPKRLIKWQAFDGFRADVRRAERRVAAHRGVIKRMLSRDRRLLERVHGAAMKGETE